MPRVVRASVLSRQHLVVALLSAGVFAAGLVAALGHDRHRSGIVELAGAIILTGAFLNLIGMARTLFAGAFLGERSVRIVNPLRTFRLAWRDIRGFTLASSRGLGGPYPCVAFAELRSGDWVRIFGIQAVERDRQRAEAAVGRLNRELALRTRSARQDAPVSPPSRERPQAGPRPARRREPARASSRPRRSEGS